MEALKNQTVIILGNGPSINDLDFVTQMKCFEMIRHGKAKIYCPAEINSTLDAVRFTRWRPSKNRDVFTEDINKGIFWGHSSVLAAIHLAYINRPGKIVLAGVDLNDCSHFYSNVGREKEFLNVKDVLADFDRVAEFMENKGVPVYNLNRDSLLKCFKYISLNDL